VTQKLGGHNGNRDRILYLNNDDLSHVRSSGFYCKHYYDITSTVRSVIVRVSVTRIDSNMIDEWLNVVCITRNFAYACWLLGDFST
jgi:hypothetical protein